MKKQCLSCKFYRPENITTGLCRVDKDRLELSEYPVMGHEDVCERWHSAGQQYYIRVGWLRGLKARQ